MRTIDVFVSAASDVQKESAITEHLIRSVAAEFDLPVRASYSNPLRGSKEDAAVEREDSGATPVVRVCFWDCPALPTADLSEWDQSQYDLVICLRWSRLAPVPVQNCVLPNGSGPWLATDYDADSILAQSRATSKDQRLRVYRNRATPNSLLEPKEEREEMCRQWDAVQEFLARWEKDNPMQFRECYQGFLDLEEFANLFRQHFRNFIVEQIYRRIDSKKAPSKSRFRGLNPFRGLNFFDAEHAVFYCGRTRAIGEVLDALKRQATSRKPLVLVLGPSGSGKTSLLRAGVLPLLTRGGTPVGGGPWSRIITRPSVGDPIDTLAAALLAELSLAGPRDATPPDESLSLASRLKKDPETAAFQIAEALGKTKMRLALVVDQLEELFIGISPVLQRKYVTALCALARSQGIYVIAALRSEFYAQYQRFPELVELTSGGGKYELQPSTACEIANMIRLPAEAAGLRFERDSETGRGLDDFLLKEATSSSDALPLLEHVLSLLYNRQFRRKDGLLRWSDYRELGQFKNALAQHAESVFSTLHRDEQHAFKLMIRQLVAPVTGKERVLIRRPVPYHELVSSPKFNHRQSAAARDVIDCLINEGLLTAEIDSKHSRLIRIPQDALLNHWSRLLNSLAEDQHFFGMRDRLDESITLWVTRGSQSDHLLHDRIALAEAETLLKDFPSALSETQITYIKKSLARQKRHGWVRRNYLGLAAIIVFVIFAVIMSAERFSSIDPRTGTKKDTQPGQPDKDLATKDANALEAKLKDTEGKAELAQQNVELANKERAALETQLKAAEEGLKQVQDTELADGGGKPLQTQLKETEEKLKQARANSEETSSQLTALQVQLRQEQDNEQKVQANVDFLTSEQNSLQSQLKQAEAKAILAQQNADLVSSQRGALETQLKEAEAKLNQAQANSGDAAGQLSALQAQLKQEQEKEQKAQVNVDSLASERTALQSQLKQAEAKTLLAQLSVDFVGKQRSALETQLKEAEAKLNKALANSGDAAGQLSALQAQLKQEQLKEQGAQANADSLTSERNALQSQLKQAEAKALLAQQSADLVSSQRNALETRLKEAEEKLTQVQANSGSAAGQRDALQTQLKQEQEKEREAQANADSLSSERNALQNQLKAAEEKLKQVQANSGDATSKVDALQTQLKQEQEKEREAQANADSLSSERNALQNQLKAAEEKLKQAQADSGDATSRADALQTQLKQEQGNEQKSQANADSLTGQRNAVQDQLKQTEAKALLAQQSADLAGSQRSALETQLKEAEAKLNQAQANSGDAAGQLNALQAQLKQEQEKEQKAQVNVDSLASERTALQSQLKQAEAKALLAQQNADLVSGQRSALETQLKEAEEKLEQVQANSGSAAGQLGALQTQLKQEQEKAQKAQATADSLTTERNLLQSQLKQAETKALLTQKNADLFSSQRNALEAQLKETEEKLKQTKPSSGDTATKLATLQARLYSSQPASPTPSPSNNPSSENSPELQPSRDGEAAGNVESSGKAESLKEFVLGYLRTVASNDTSLQRRYFADRVRFYGRGVLDSSHVDASTEEYHREWPIREWTPRGEARIARLRHGNRFVVHQPFEWAVSDGSRHAQGNATLYLLIHRDSQGELKIVNVHQLDR